MVSTTESKRSWHGTSVQCVQPMPESIKIPVQEMHSACEELCMHEEDTVECVRMHYSSLKSIVAHHQQCLLPQNKLKSIEGHLGNILHHIHKHK